MQEIYLKQLVETFNNAAPSGATVFGSFAAGQGELLRRPPRWKVPNSTTA